jgi:glutamate dehydrogenase
MSLDAETRKLALIDRVVALAGETTPERAHFLRAFYRNTAPDDVLTRRPEDLLAAARSIWQAMAERRPGRLTIRVLDPRDPAAAWTSGRSVIQLINDDMPFLVDTVTAALSRLDLAVHLLIHPVLKVERDQDGRVVALGPEAGGDLLESVMQIELGGPLDAARRDEVVATLDAVLADVRVVVLDWPAMRRRAERMADELTTGALPVPAAEASEIAAFLIWLADDNFIFLGYREYTFGGEGLTVVPEFHAAVAGRPAIPALAAADDGLEIEPAFDGASRGAARYDRDQAFRRRRQGCGPKAADRPVHLDLLLPAAAGDSGGAAQGGENARACRFRAGQP